MGEQDSGNQLVTIVIPNWNGRSFLAPCLRGLERQTFTDYVVIVVDNGSTDGSVEWVKRNLPRVQVIANEENRGFAAAVNQGIQVSNSRYVATLNNDTEAKPRWLEALVEAVESDPRVGMCPQLAESVGESADQHIVPCPHYYHDGRLHACRSRLKGTIPSFFG